MDFFQAQDDALKKTKRLVFYYALAVLLIIFSVYFAVTAGFFTYNSLVTDSSQYGQYSSQVALWDTSRFLTTMVIVLVLTGTGTLLKTLSLRGGGSVVATSLGGELVDRSTQDPKRRQLLNVVEEMAIASGVPVPEVYLLKQEPSINAFAAGWSTDDAVIAVSAGALNKLSRDELQGVVAHEYSHILHGDCRLNIRLMGILYGILMLTVFGRLMGAVMNGGRRGGGFIFVGGGGGGSRKGGKNNGGAIIIAVIVVIVLVTIIGYIGSFFARMIQAAVSRQREYLADASAVQFTRNPDGISGALKRIAGQVEQPELQHPSASEAAHMFFTSGIKQSFINSMSTHPPLRDRIEKLLPGWNGDLSVQPVRKPQTKAEPSSRATRSAGREMFEGMAILGAVGTLSSGNLDVARGITGAIPEQLDNAMRETEGARFAILSLLVVDNQEDDTSQFAHLEKTFSSHELKRLQTVMTMVNNLPREARLGALELATTTLAQSPRAGHENFLSLINRLIDSDGYLSLYEFCIRRILKERMNRGKNVASTKAEINYMALNPQLASGIGNLLSVVARESLGENSSNSDYIELANRSVKSLYLLNGKVRFPEEPEKAVEGLDEAIDFLRQAAYAIRAQVLRAAVFCIKEDGQLTPGEAELLRMLSLSLDCPIPPMGN